MRTLFICLVTTIVIFVAVSQHAASQQADSQQTSSHFNGNSWWGYVKVLAADDMEDYCCAAVDSVLRGGRGDLD